MVNVFPVLSVLRTAREVRLTRNHAGFEIFRQLSPSPYTTLLTRWLFFNFLKFILFWQLFGAYQAVWLTLAGPINHVYYR